MARLVAGGTPDAVTTSATEEFTAPNSTAQVRYQLLVPRQACTVFLAKTGGNSLVDLRLDADGSVLLDGIVIADDNGQLPAFRLPDELKVDGVWVDPDDGSTERFYLPVRFGPLQASTQIATEVPGVVASTPAILTAVLAAVTGALASLGVPTTQVLAYAKYVGDVWYAADQFGNLSDLGFADDGSVAEATAMSLFIRRLMPRAFVSPDGTPGMRFTDINGVDSWVGWDENGAPDPIAQRWIYNVTGKYMGPDEPDPYPGYSVEWTKTDRKRRRTGEVIDVVRDPD